MNRFGFNFILLLLAVSVLPQFGFAQEQPLLQGLNKSQMELPDISIIADLVGTFNDNDEDENPDKDKFTARSAELCLGGYLYPSIRGDVVMAVHRHEGEYEWDLEEAYISFLDTLVPNVGLTAGKKLLNFGKINPLHPHHWDYIDTPAVYQGFLGEHGLVGQGGQLNFLVPAPFFIQLEGGFWHMEGGHSHSHEEEESNAEEEEEEHHHGMESLGVFDDAVTGRLWMSFPVSDAGDLQLGFSGIRGKGPHFEEHDDDVSIYGMDLTYRHSFNSYRKFLFQGELYRLNREIPIGDYDRLGTYLFTKFQINKQWDIGFRYDWMELPSFEEHHHEDEHDEGEDEEEEHHMDLDHAVDVSYASLIVTRNLTETTRIRAQYRYDIEGENNDFMIQLVFGIGPHSHPLQ